MTLLQPATPTSTPWANASSTGACYGLVAPLYEMAKVLAARLADVASNEYRGSVTATKLKSQGSTSSPPEIFPKGRDGRSGFARSARGIYSAQSCEATGSLARCSMVIRPMVHGSSISSRPARTSTKMRDTLIYASIPGRGVALDPVAAVAALSDEAEICGCNGVSKGAIVSAIRSKGLTTIDDVRAVTKASASCGQCTSKVRRVLAAHGRVLCRPAGRPCASALT